MLTDHDLLKSIAVRVMLERGLLPEFSSRVISEVAKLDGGSGLSGKNERDLRNLLWCSIDNDDSRDLDQLTTAEQLEDGGIKIYVAVSDVDALVKKDSAIDAHAKQNTTSVYTAGGNFPMLPEKLSFGLTSLNSGVDRRALIIEMNLDKEGTLKSSSVYTGIVNNKAKLAYDSVAAWLDGTGAIPKEIPIVLGMEENLRLQDATAQKFKEKRRSGGALDFRTIELHSVFFEGKLSALKEDRKNRAKELIEEFMVAVNGVIARFLTLKKFPSLRRVVRKPKLWLKIVALAAEKGYKLPVLPDSKALEIFLQKEKLANPESFPDLSLSIIKLLGPGEYIAEVPGEIPVGHFGLAVKDYTHSTAPNRRYPDIIILRLLKAAIGGSSCPYGKDELIALANHCTTQENAVKKVERQVSKSAAALLLRYRIGEKFNAIVTGASEKGTWVRLSEPPVEGKLSEGYEGLEVGMRVLVRLVSTDVERGFIDLEKA